MRASLGTRLIFLCFTALSIIMTLGCGGSALQQSAGSSASNSPPTTAPPPKAPPPPPPPPTLTFSAAPATIIAGSSSTLSWTTTNATSLVIDNEIGAEQNVAAGSVSVSPAATTTYTATAVGANNQTATQTAVVTVNPPLPKSGMVIVVMEENHRFDRVIGPQSPMVFLNSLAQRGTLLTQYFADAHPSLPNYLELTSGAMEATDDGFTGVIAQDNLAREFAAAGTTWKVYAEDLPGPGYLGVDTGNYVKHHNPFVYYSDVVNSPEMAANIVPFTQFGIDLNSGMLPSFSFVVPDIIDDAHSCPNGPLTCSDDELLSRADQWLNANIGPVLSSSQFESDGLLLVLFDEADLGDIRHGGGQVALVAFGTKVKAGFESSIFYQHENTLSTICMVLDLKICPGLGATVAPESDIFAQVP